MRHEPYANTDPSLHYNRIEPRSKGPTWQSVWIYLLKAGDEEAAQLVKDQNPTLSYECEGGDHDGCHYPSCECAHHTATVVSATHAPLRSCREMEIEQQIEQEELETV